MANESAESGWRLLTERDTTYLGGPRLWRSI